MFEIEIYEDAKGNSPISDYLESLNEKAQTYCSTILLKKLKKTPKSEIEKAKHNLKDFLERSQ